MLSVRRMRGSGFTLFEVLAAVLVLGLFYSVLATKASQGLRAEGENRRRLEASLLADDALARLETLIAVGTPPPIERSEEVFDIFTVAAEVLPLDLQPLLPPELFPEGYEGDSLLRLPSTGENSFLRTIDVRVSWLEADEPREVHRITYAYNTTLLDGLFPGGTAGEPTGGDAETDANPFINQDGSPNLDAMRDSLMNSEVQE